MICPNCGAEIAEENLLCSVCGYEIQIVPEFEAEVNLTIEETISGISAGIAQAADNKKKKIEQQNIENKLGKLKRLVKRNIRLLLFACIAIICVICLFFLSYDSKEEEVSEKIDIALKDGDIKNAIKRAERVYTNNAGDIQNMILLGKLYTEDERLLDAKAMYHQVIEAAPDNLEAYDGLVGLYLKEENYDQIGELISASKEEKIRSTFERFISLPPVFSVKQGSYDDIVKLQMSANTEGKIFYTLDGSVPDKDSEEYTGEIVLDQGIWTVSAIFLNNYSIESDITTCVYEINLPRPDEVSVTPESGSYTKPTSIVASASSDVKIYYTTNGSDPTVNSTLYKNPISMPFGKSVYKFVAVDEKGNLSDVATFEYNFKLDSPIDLNYAQNLLFDQLLDLGIVIDRNGTIPSMEGQLIYKCSTAIDMGGENYYLFEEFMDVGDGSHKPTRTFYCINAGNGLIYKAITNSSGGYMIQPFED